MNLKLIFLIISLFKISIQQTSTNNIIFDLADLTIDYESDVGYITLEAFKSSLNNLIIEKQETSKYGQLNWLSIGYPILTLTPSPTNANVLTLFVLKPEGFDVSVEMLTNVYRKLFKQVVLRKYNIDVKEEQIVSLIPAKFECSLSFYENSQRILINGRVTQLTRTPLKLTFFAPNGTKERILFEKRLNKDKLNLNLDILCEISSTGTTYRQNTLVISGSQLNKIGLVDKIFGKGDERYVTRNQVSQLSSELYQKLNIIEEYQIPESEFKENFINDFVKQTASLIFENVNINETLNLLSPYNFLADIKPSVIYNEMSRLFMINKTASKELLQLNRTQYNRLIKTYGLSIGGSTSGSIFGIFDFGGSASFATSSSSDWASSNTLFTNQLNELNTYYENEVEWARSGNIIVPKSVKVSKLSRASFEKNLIFSRVKRKFTEAPFKRSFTLETLKRKNVSDVYSDQNKKLAELEQNLKNITLNYDNLNNGLKFLNKSQSELYDLISNLNTSTKITTETIKTTTSTTTKNYQEPIQFPLLFANDDLLVEKKNSVCQQPDKYGFIRRLGTNNFYALSDLGLAWFEAELFCQTFGAHLPIIRRAEDNSFLRWLTGDKVKINNVNPGHFGDWGQHTGIWLGGFKPSFSNAWKWIDGTQFTYTEWSTIWGVNNQISENVLQDGYDRNLKKFIGWSDAPMFVYNQITVCELKC